MNTELKHITDKIIERSKASREIYLDRVCNATQRSVYRQALGCSNLAHGFAACSDSDKKKLADTSTANIAIISAYNDMLSAHQPFHTYPDVIKDELQKINITAQFAGGVPAMCDGVTQSQPGMELSLFSRDIIAQSTAIALSHNMFDAALYLGVCDKIVPGLLIGALSFGHLPAAFIPAGPMTSGVSNNEKAKIRQEFAQGKVGKKTLLITEAGSYHSPGTCTFYGTANSNQMLMEIMGLHLPGSSFINANTPLREKVTRETTRQLSQLTPQHGDYLPIGLMLDERSFVNAIVGLLATGGSSNHTIHLIAMARAAGIILNWDDFHELSKIIPLLAKLYPNGNADVNHFHAAGGMPVIIHELLENGLLHNDVQTIMGQGLQQYCYLPVLKKDSLSWYIPPPPSERNIFSTFNQPFDKEGGISILHGNIGRCVVKTSALKQEHRKIKAPAIIFESQQDLQTAFKRNLLNQDFVAVVRHQGPKANGMPELHGLLPAMGSLQDQGHKVAILTDGRMSGASGKVLSAIHVTPEAKDGGMIGTIKNGDLIEIDIESEKIELIAHKSETIRRDTNPPDLTRHHVGMGRELFSSIRERVSNAEEGATIFSLPGQESN